MISDWNEAVDDYNRKRDRDRIQALEAENKRLREENADLRNWRNHYADDALKAKVKAADALAEAVRDVRDRPLGSSVPHQQILQALYHYEQILAAPSTTHSGQSGGGVPCAPTPSSGGDECSSTQGAAPSTGDVGGDVTALDQARRRDG